MGVETDPLGRTADLVGLAEDVPGVAAQLLRLATWAFRAVREGIWKNEALKDGVLNLDDSIISTIERAFRVVVFDQPPAWAPLPPVDWSEECARRLSVLTRDEVRSGTWIRWLTSSSPAGIAEPMQRWLSELLLAAIGDSAVEGGIRPAFSPETGAIADYVLTRLERIRKVTLDELTLEAGQRAALVLSHLEALESRVARFERTTLGLVDAEYLLAGAASGSREELLMREWVSAKDFDDGNLLVPNTWRTWIDGLGLSALSLPEAQRRIILSPPGTGKSVALAYLAKTIRDQPGRRCFIILGKRRGGVSLADLKPFLAELDQVRHVLLIDDLHLLPPDVSEALAKTPCSWFAFARAEFRSEMRAVARGAGLPADGVESATWLQEGIPEVARWLWESAGGHVTAPLAFRDLLKDEFRNDLSIFELALQEVGGSRLPRKNDAADRVRAVLRTRDADSAAPYGGDILRLLALAWQFELPVPLSVLSAIGWIPELWPRSLDRLTGEKGEVRIDRRRAYLVRHPGVASVFAAATLLDVEARQRLCQDLLHFVGSRRALADNLDTDDPAALLLAAVASVDVADLRALNNRLAYGYPDVAPRRISASAFTVLADLLAAANPSRSAEALLHAGGTTRRLGPDSLRRAVALLDSARAASRKDQLAPDLLSKLDYEYAYVFHLQDDYDTARAWFSASAELDGIQPVTALMSRGQATASYFRHLVHERAKSGLRYEADVLSQLISQAHDTRAALNGLSGEDAQRWLSNMYVHEAFIVLAAGLGSAGAMELLDRATEIRRSLDQPSADAKTSFLTALALFQQRRFDEALEPLAASKELYRRGFGSIEKAESVGDVLILEGQVLAALNRPSDVDDVMRQAEQLLNGTANGPARELVRRYRANPGAFPHSGADWLF